MNMRSGLACFLSLAGVALTNAAFGVEKRHGPAVLAVPMVRDTAPQLSRRSKGVDVSLKNEEVNYVSYVANVTFGTPPQNILAYFDTWGNGCWLYSVDNSDCDLYVDHASCGGYGAYNLTASTTAKRLDDEFAYDDSGAMTTGDFVTDVLKIGGVKVDTMKMGIITEPIITANTLSLGYGNASSISLTQALADAGTINSPAFSLWGQTALFGGINKARYYGPLYTFPIVKRSDLPKALRVNMDGISINKTSAASTTFPLDAVFDTAVSMSYVPKSVAQALNAQIGNTSVPDEHGQVNFSCSAMGENSTIEFKFGKLEFQFYLSQFVSQQSDIATNDGWYSDEETCYFTICENVHLQYEGSIVLGSNFMSTVYAVFDLENDEISLANLNWWEHNPDDIVEITSGKNGVPGAKSGASESKSGTSGAENGTPGATKASAGTHIEKGLGMMAVLVGAVVMLNL